VAADSWTMVPSTASPACGTGGAHGVAPTAFARGIVNSFGGYSAGLTDFCRANEAFGFDTRSSSWLPIARNVTAGTRRGHVWLSVGDRVFMSGGICLAGSECNDAWLFDPSMRSMDGWTRLANPPMPTALGSEQFALFTGRSIVSFGGSMASLSVVSGGSIGVVEASTVRWHALPASGSPSARHSFVNVEGDTQGLWTGREAMIWGGSDNSMRFNDGARYQPPVGCVCPVNADAPAWLPNACAGVSISGTPTCNP
jgi:hypothetical protein